MHLQPCTGTVDIGHDRQTVETWESAARASTIARLARDGSDCYFSKKKLRSVMAITFLSGLRG